MDLNSSVASLSFVGPIYQRRLEKLEIKKVKDLLWHIPHRYIDFSKTYPISDLRVGDIVTVKGVVTLSKNQYTKSGRKIQLVEISDSTGNITAVWFNQPFLVRTLYPGIQVSFAGEIGWFGNKIALISPEYEKVIPGKELSHTGKIVGIYPETSGISSKWLRGRIQEAFLKTKKYIDKELADALEKVHFPKKMNDAEEGRKTLAFDELLMLQLQSMHKRRNWQKNCATYKLTLNQKLIGEFIESLPFTLTDSQKEAVNEIFSDLKKDYPMNRLLEGDVGSGKTVVAAIAAFVAFINGNQAIFMAPTQILAEQHFATLNNLFKNYKLRISLITSETKKEDVGRVDIFVGTHALIHQKLNLDKVALVVIDEQHRFGVEQRAHLIKKVGRKSISPHILTMTATPIPRTVALTFYGDLDLSTLKELPAGRQTITSWIVPPQKREGAYEWIRKQIKDYKSQVFIVCPLIEESDKETMKDVKAVSKEYESLKRIYKEFGVGLLHGRLKTKEKSGTLNEFRKGNIDILVATPVVEVGIDVPNATIMVIEGSDRFGLAQLHQLRGRVGRGKAKSYCLMFSESQSSKVLTRLNAMTKNLSGFELSELDLKLRGPGEIFGIRQSGIPELKIANWGDFELIKKAKEVALKHGDEIKLAFYDTAT